MKSLTDRHHRAMKFELALPDKDGNYTRADGTVEKLPVGVCGRMTGIALVYGVADDYGTVFEPGCLDKTRTERVAAGKVKLFADHGPFTDTHVGTVRSITDVGDAAVMVADLFETQAGRTMKEYLEAVLNSKSETGLSIGFRPVKKEWKSSEASGNGDTMPGDSLLHYIEIQLREISITPVPAVPGTEVTGVRRQENETDTALLLRVLANILREVPESDARAAVDAAYAKSTAKTDTEAAPPAADAAKVEGTTDADKAGSASETHGEELVDETTRMEFARSQFTG